MGTSREQMIVQNLPLVAYVVGKMSDENGSSVIDREDAMAYGTEGLIQAVDNYDAERGTTFASFAIRRIRARSSMRSGAWTSCLARYVRAHVR